MDILDTTSPWDCERPWMPIEQRDAAANALLANPKVDHAALFNRMSKDFPLCCQLLFSTHDPRRRPAWMPFKLWPYQVKIGECFNYCFENGLRLICEKSRDVGVSFEVGVWLLWMWMLSDDFHALLTSRSKDMVDSLKEPDTMFERMRRIIEQIPARFKELLLPGWTPRVHSTFARLVNPVNGNTITGEPPTKDFGRQGRYSVIVIDEAASCANLKDMLAACGDSANVQFYLSTPKGMSGPFWEMRQEAIRTGNMPVITVHWTVHPLKSKGKYRIEERNPISQLAVLANKVK